MPLPFRQALEQQPGFEAQREDAAVAPRALEAAAVSASAVTGESGEIRPLWQEERAVIERAIKLCDGNIPKAAALLEISASTIYRKRAAWEKAGGNG